MVTRAFRIFFLSAALVGLTHCATKKKELESKSLKLSESFYSLFKDPPENMDPWFEFDMSQKSLLFFSRNHRWIQKAWKGKLESLNFQEWESRLPLNQAVFDFVEYKSEKHLMIDMDMGKGESVRSLLHTILHEGFHGFYQIKPMGWKDHKLSQGRGEIYPLQAIPRYYRWEMHQSLLNYLSLNNEKDLEAFAYWYWKWKETFKEEYENYTDRVEGSAQYYSFMQMVRLVNMYANKEIPPLLYFESMGMGKLDLKTEFSLSIESYVIGALAGTALQRLSVPGWQKMVNKGLSPMEILAGQFKKRHRNPNHKVQNEFLMLSIKKMELIDKDGKIDGVIAGLANQKTHRVLISLKDSAFSSFTATGMYRPFFNFIGLAHVEIVGLGSPLHLKKKSVNLNYGSGDYWVSARTNPCFKDFSGTLLIYKPSEIQYKNGFISATSPSPFRAKAKKKVIKGVTWYCVD